LTPFRRTLEYSALSVRILSPSTVTVTGTGARPAKLKVQPEVLPVAFRTYFVGVVSPLAGTEDMFHLPATSARLIGAGAAGAADVVEAVDDATMVEVVSTAALSFLAHPAISVAQQQSEMRVARCNVGMKPPLN
ncbi:MAG TPA: hypothetical protein VIG78_10150, partial [Gemmatimonadaceae bacterium]